MTEQTAQSSTMVMMNALPHPVVMVDANNCILQANSAAEVFFHSSQAYLKQKTLDHFLPFRSPLSALVEQVRQQGSIVNEYKVDLSSPRIGKEKVVDLYVAPVMELEGAVVVMFQLRTMADKMDRQLTHRGAARSVVGLATMLAHEIKNPLSGIRGAAQLLDSSIRDEDRELTRLITDETDRIVKLVDRMEVFSDDRPIERDPVNIHSVLERVKNVSVNGFGREIKLVENYDPSLPPVHANRDQLIQVLLNLVKNAAEALEAVDEPVITLATAFRAGVHLSAPGSSTRVSLPIEICVTDNGPGVPDDILANMFDPFVTTKTNGSGLGLALVAKIVGDHGGVIECESANNKTMFRILLPKFEKHVVKHLANTGNPIPTHALEGQE